MQVWGCSSSVEISHPTLNHSKNVPDDTAVIRCAEKIYDRAVFKLCLKVSTNGLSEGDFDEYSEPYHANHILHPALTK